MKDVGGSIASAAGTATGWLADGVSAGLGLATGLAGSAVGCAANVANTVTGAVGSLAGGAIKAATSLTSGAVGAAGSLVSKALGGIGSMLTTSPTPGGVEADGQPQKSSGGFLSSLGNALGSVFNGASTAVGVVSNIGSKSVASVGGVLSGGVKAASSLAGGVVGFSGNAVGGVLRNMSGRLNNLVTSKDVASRDVTSVSQDDIQTIGAIEQMRSALKDVSDLNPRIERLNSAQSGLPKQLVEVDTLAQKVCEANLMMSELGHSDTGITELNDVVERVVKQVGNLPSPIESHVQMTIGK